MVGYGVSIFLITIGAILKFAIRVPDDLTVDLEAMGVILMAVGGATFVFQLITEMRRSKETTNNRTHSFDRDGPPPI
jgi:hypothetical protein